MEKGNVSTRTSPNTSGYRSGVNLWDMDDDDDDDVIYLDDSDEDAGERVQDKKEYRGDAKQPTEEGDDEIEEEPANFDGNSQSSGANKLLSVNLDEMERAMDAIVNDVAAIIDQPASVTRVMLIHMNWNKEKLLDKFYSSTLVDLLVSSHLLPEDLYSPSVGLESFEGDCEICCGEDVQLGTSGRCGHYYCHDCWKGFVLSQAESGLTNAGPGGGPGDEAPIPPGLVKCMQIGCQMVLTREKLMEYLADDEDAKRVYRRAEARLFVETSRQLRTCPGTDCEYAALLPKGVDVPNRPQTTTRMLRRADCKCGTSYCFACAAPWHEPIDCALLVRWKERVVKPKDDDQENNKWMLENSKKCPRCASWIEKNGGCNHMTCRKAGCGHEFCWLCLQNHHGHDQQRCNTYQAQADASRAAEMDAIVRSSARFEHYRERWATHAQSRELEAEMCDRIKKAAHTAEISENEGAWLFKACNVLLDARRTLEHSFIFAYYANNDLELTIFEGNQSDLAVAVERLSDTLDKSLTEELWGELLLDEDKKTTSEAWATVKRILLDESGYVAERRAVLVAHCDEGYDAETWTWSEGR